MYPYSKDDQLSIGQCIIKCSISFTGLIFLGIWSQLDVIDCGAHQDSWVHRLKFWTNWTWSLTIVYVILAIYHNFKKYFCSCAHFKSGSKRPYYCSNCSKNSERLGKFHQVTTACNWQISFFYWIILRPYITLHHPLEMWTSSGFHLIPIIFCNLEIFMMDQHFNCHPGFFWDYILPNLQGQFYGLYNFILWSKFDVTVYEPLNYQDYLAQAFFIVSGLAIFFGSWLNKEIKVFVQRNKSKIIYAGCSEVSDRIRTEDLQSFQNLRSFYWIPFVLE